jgi:hypothetical protein
MGRDKKKKPETLCVCGKKAGHSGECNSPLGGLGG